MGNTTVSLVHPELSTSRTGQNQFYLCTGQRNNSSTQKTFLQVFAPQCSTLQFINHSCFNTKEQ